MNQTLNVEPEKIPRLQKTFIRRIFSWFRPFLPHLIGISLLIIVGVILQVVQPLVLRNLVDQATAETDLLRLGLAAGLLVLLPVIVAILGVIQRRLASEIGVQLTFNLRTSIYNHLQGLPYRMFVHAPPGEINARLSGDMMSTHQLATRAFPDAFSGGLRILGIFIAMFMLEWRLTLAALAVLPLVAWMIRRRNYRARKAALETMQLNAALGLQVGETLNPAGILNVRLFDRTLFEKERYRNLANEIRKTESRQDMIQAEGVIATTLIAALGTALVYAVGGLLVAAHSFTIGTVIAFVSYLSGLYSAAQSLVGLGQPVAMALVSFERIFELLDLDNEKDAPAVDAKALPVRARGSLAFSNVTFNFNDEVPLKATARPWSMAMMGSGKGASESKTVRDALAEINFSVEPGQMVALVGPSGAGKSTIFNLIPRFYDPDSGQITLDGHSLQDLPLAWLRNQVGFVSQNIYMLPGTLGDNLRYANPDASLADLDAACQAANLSAFVASLPNGYDTFVGTSGARLSGGERQRLALARVLLKNAPILLLDEPTSQLDSLSEQVLQDALARAREGRSMLVIAHRLSTVLSSDLILVLDEGKIVERGTHAELLAQGGLYARLYEVQFSHQDVMEETPDD